MYHGNPSRDGFLFSTQVNAAITLEKRLHRFCKSHIRLGIHDYSIRYAKGATDLKLIQHRQINTNVKTLKQIFLHVNNEGRPYPASSVYVNSPSRFYKIFFKRNKIV
jgi:hypothetical protein